ncbi:MAG: elongation factor G [Kiritimatiellae bacterium]|nr:elongation factor G [Kiritimatiellia bacterium]MDD5523019.1 elongation factor G [Kiritimatiellia bacterium]
MNDIPVSDVRNFVIMGHTGSGKTTFIDALLFKFGLNDRFGSVSAGSSMVDYTDEEKHRKTSIYAKPFTAVYKSVAGKSYDLVFTDTPGYMDFYGQVIAATRATEAALITIDAAAGIQVGTHRVWRLCEKQGIPRGILVTGLDKENTDFKKLVAGIQSTFGDKCVPVILPLPDKSGVVDVFGKNMPAALAGEADAIKSTMSERAAETSDALIEKFLGGEALTPEELANGMRLAVARGIVVPIFVCMALKNIGVTETLEGIARMFPSPADRPAKDAEGKEIPSGANESFVGYVWRTVNDSFVGNLAFVRVLGGTLKADSEFQNTSKNQKERVGALLQVNGKKQVPVTSATAGDIVALTKLKAVTTVGDTMGAVGSKVVCDKIKFPSPTMFMAVYAKTSADEDKIGTALARVSEEDPTLKVERNVETKETILQGLGDVQIDVAVERMKLRSNVDVVLSTPKVPYRETVTSLGDGHYKHKKQSGGRGQYGEVYMKVDPNRGKAEEWFVDALVGGAIPGNFVPAIQKGVLEGMASGAVAGYPVTGVRVTIYDGSYHDVDSSEIAFKIAGSRAFRDAMSKAKPVLLEPIMTVKVMVPDQFLGDINGDLNHRRGRIMGMGNEEGMQVITAEVPQSELFRYVAELRSMTGGQGTFEMEFLRYDIVPSNVAQKVIAASDKKKVEENE